MMPCLESFPVPLIHLEETNSTISYLSELCNRQCVPELTTVMADFQTSGRGQRGNSWESEKEKNLLFSFVLYPSFLEARNQFLLSQIVSLSVKEVLERYVGNTSIKWPNDIYWEEKKICGMLIENNLTGIHITRSIVGIGININQEVFHSSAPNPVSIKQITGKEYNPIEILAGVMQRMKENHLSLQQGETEAIARRYHEALFRNEGTHPFRDSKGEFTAQITGVEPDGHLVLLDNTDKIRRYVFKEVQYVL